MPRPAPVLLALLAATALVAGCSGEPDRRGTPPAAAPVEPAPATPASPSPSPSPTPEPQPVPVPIEWSSCGNRFQCAVLPVPLDRADPASGTVDLALLRRPVRDPAKRIGSLVINPGGPGGSGVEYLRAAWQGIPEPVRDRFDLVSFDPRGVGASEPVRCLTTEEMDAAVALDPTPDDAAELRAVEAAGRQLAAGCAARSARVLPHVSTEQVARDVDLLRASLGDPGLTYLGYSYGTSIGAEYLRLFPTRVRAMVLDGALDPSLTWEQLLEGQATGFDVALAAFLADCERIRCPFRRAVRGDLTAAFDALAARLEGEPLPADGPRRLGPGEFSLGVGAGLYSRRSGWPAVADGLAAAVRGDGGPLLALSDSYLERTEDGYANVSEANSAVNCIDRPWPRETAAYLALAERVRPAAPRFGPAIALAGLGCAAWTVPAVREPGPVRGEGAPPVVVIGVTRDPATPYAWSQALAGQLDSGVLLTVDGDGHTAYRTGAPACVRKPVDAYLLTAQAPPPTSC